MLTQVHFAGIKSLLDVTIDLERFTVLVGPNGCGKSTVLDQIEVLCRASVPDRSVSSIFGSAGPILDGLNVDSLRTVGSGLGLRWHAVDRAGSSLTVATNPSVERSWSYTGVVEAQSSGGTVRIDPSSERGNKEQFDALLASRFSWRAQRLGLVPAAIRAPSPMTTLVLSPDGGGLATVLKDLATDDTQAYLDLQRDLQCVVPQFVSLKIPKSGQDNRISLVMKGAGEVPADRISDGTLTALALLTATHNRALPNLILMDDIDHGLHLTAQFELIKAIRAVMKVREDLQVICTTHSPVLLDSFDASEVRVMALDAEGHTHVRPLKEHPEFARYDAALQTGELWASTGEDWVLDAAAGK